MEWHNIVLSDLSLAPLSKSTSMGLFTEGIVNMLEQVALMTFFSQWDISQIRERYLIVPTPSDSVKPPATTVSSMSRSK